MTNDFVSGKHQAWKLLMECNPDTVCQNARVTFDDTVQCYTIQSFGQALTVSLPEKKISGSSTEAHFLLNKLSYFAEMSILWYLISARNIPISGKLIDPVNIKGGIIFEKGTHVLPLDKIATIYGSNINRFIKKANNLNAEFLAYGDASIRFYPLPRIPAVIILWKDNDEFPARARLLFDSSCKYLLPPDILWSTAVMCTLVMM